jgi:hypothetical protein
MSWAKELEVATEVFGNEFLQIQCAVGHWFFSFAGNRLRLKRT